MENMASRFGPISANNKIKFMTVSKWNLDNSNTRLPINFVSSDQLKYEARNFDLDVIFTTLETSLEEAFIEATHDFEIVFICNARSMPELITLKAVGNCSQIVLIDQADTNNSTFNPDCTQNTLNFFDRHIRCGYNIIDLSSITRNSLDLGSQNYVLYNVNPGNFLRFSGEIGETQYLSQDIIQEFFSQRQ